MEIWKITTLGWFWGKECQLCFPPLTPVADTSSWCKRMTEGSINTQIRAAYKSSQWNIKRKYQYRHWTYIIKLRTRNKKNTNGLLTLSWAGLIDFQPLSSITLPSSEALGFWCFSAFSFLKCHSSSSRQMHVSVHFISPAIKTLWCWNLLQVL